MEAGGYVQKWRRLSPPCSDQAMVAATPSSPPHRPVAMTRCSWRSRRAPGPRSPLTRPPAPPCSLCSRSLLSRPRAPPLPRPPPNCRCLEPPRVDRRQQKPSSVPSLPLRLRNRGGIDQIVDAVFVSFAVGHRRFAASSSSPFTSDTDASTHATRVSPPTCWTSSCSLSPSRCYSLSPQSPMLLCAGLDTGLGRPKGRLARVSAQPRARPGPASRPAASGAATAWPRSGPALRPAASATDPTRKPAWADLWAGPTVKTVFF